MHLTCIIIFFLAAFNITSCHDNNCSVNNVNCPCLQSALTSTTSQSPATQNSSIPSSTNLQPAVVSTTFQSPAAQNSSISSSTSLQLAVVSTTSQSPAAQNSSISSSTSLQPAVVSTTSQSPVAQTSSTSKSITAQASSSSSLSPSISSSQSGTVSSTTISSSNNLPQAPTSSTISNAEPSVPSPCVPGTCNKYKLLACPGGVCACGQDINHTPTCFQDKPCTDMAKCNNNADCGTSEACMVNSCCGSGGYCAPRMVGCLTSPVWIAPRLEPTSKKIKARSISALGEGEIGITGFGVDT